NGTEALGRRSSMLWRTPACTQISTGCVITAELQGLAVSGGSQRRSGYRMRKRRRGFSIADDIGMNGNRAALRVVPTRAPTSYGAVAAGAAHSFRLCRS